MICQEILAAREATCDRLRRNAQRSVAAQARAAEGTALAQRELRRRPVDGKGGYGQRWSNSPHTTCGPYKGSITKGKSPAFFREILKSRFVIFFRLWPDFFHLHAGRLSENHCFVEMLGLHSTPRVLIFEDPPKINVYRYKMIVNKNQVLPFQDEKKRDLHFWVIKLGHTLEEAGFLYRPWDSNHPLKHQVLI